MPEHHPVRAGDTKRRGPYPKTGDLWDIDGKRWRIDWVQDRQVTLRHKRNSTTVAIDVLRQHHTPIECVREGDAIIDPLGGRNTVVDLRRLKLLLEDPNGMRFVIQRDRLAGAGGPWTHHPLQHKARTRAKGRPPRIATIHRQRQQHHTAAQR